MIRKWTEHSMYLHHLELEISSLSIPEKNRLFRMHHVSLLKLTLLNLDNLFPVVKPLYPVLGRPAKNQCELLRSLILMIDFKKQSITDWAFGKRTNERTCTKKKAPANRSSFGVYSFDSALFWYRV